MKSRDELIDDLLTLAFAEDVGDGDHTTLSTIPADEIGRQQLIVKEEGILAGVEIARRVFEKFDPELKMTVYINDGAHVKPGDVAFVVEGRVQSLLQTERIMLNIMQRMSGTATQAAKYQERLSGLKTKVIDTRKTTPGMRILEKEAVKIGGGGNHRMGLFDMILIKDNHVDFAGGIPQAVNAAKEYCRKKRQRPENRGRGTQYRGDRSGSGCRCRPHNARQLHGRAHPRSGKADSRTHRNRIVGRYNARHSPRIRRMRRRLYISRRADSFGQRP